jgi:uncharacterized SAM-binding protein YcdF (DUF218 family)
MELLAASIIKSIILPPGLFFMLLAIGMLFLYKHPSSGKTVLWLGILISYLLSTPFVANRLAELVETYPALDMNELATYDAGAIVILSGARERNAIEFGGDSVSRNTLLRCRYGAFLHHKTGLPILVSGGRVLDKEGKSLAQTMAEVLVNEFHTGAVWLEDKSRTTWENALFSSQFLEQRNIDSAYLVTQALHMPRSVTAFENAGLKVIPAPTAFVSGKASATLAFMPASHAIHTSHMALHEILGALWYRVRYH